METQKIQNPINKPDVQIDSPTTIVYKGNEVIVENEHYINSKKCEFDGNTSNMSVNDDAFYQSSCDDIIHNEENFELIKDEMKSPKITNTITTDNHNSTELREEKMEKCSEPQLNCNKPEIEQKNKSVNSVKNSKVNDTLLTTKKKSKKLSKIPKHKKSYVKLYLKLKEKFNKKSKSNQKATKKELPIRDVSESPINVNREEKEKSFDEKMEVTPMNSANNLTTEPNVQNELSVEADSSNNAAAKPNDTNVFSDTVEVTPVNDTDVREITVITADGETILLSTNKRTDSLSRYNNLDQHKLSVLSDSTITPQKLSMRNESVIPVERTPVILEDEEQKSEHASIEQENKVASDENIENGTPIDTQNASDENIENGTPIDTQNSKIIITTVQEEVVPDDDGKDKVIITKIEEQVVIESDEEEENKENLVKVLC
ncbi:hypothetical protein PIROE2DRAFT_3370 [Piromyces sp. E2]|nr:hypothetical protein PIROE2DRAFT_3370 [Piromyces sp. E2]|eukprot:OUM68849.1 hypothetical protein PIROE2DRAFT_3370 [Piromyces sp. E2]